MFCDNISDFSIRDHKIIPVSIRIAAACQIPCHKKGTPEIID